MQKALVARSPELNKRNSRSCCTESLRRRIITEQLSSIFDEFLLAFSEEILDERLRPRRHRNCVVVAFGSAASPTV